MAINVIPKQQRFDRWDALPDTLREALVSEDNSHIIWETCRAEHIPEEKISLVTRVTGYVLLGFLHPEDAAREIADALEIDKKIAESIASKLKSKIFEPLKTEIDKIYAPAMKQSTPFISLESIDPVGITPKPTSMPTPPPVPRLSDEAKRAAEEIDRVLTKIQKTIPPMPIEGISTSRSYESQTPPKQVSFDSSRESTATGGGSGPVFLHRESPSESSGPRTAAGFHLEISKPSFGEARQESPASRIAKLEVGSETEKKPSTPPQPPKPKVVHYGVWDAPAEGKSIPSTQPFGIIPSKQESTSAPSPKPEATKTAPPLSAPTISPLDKLGVSFPSAEMNDPPQIPSLAIAPKEKEKSSFFGKLFAREKKQDSPIKIKEVEIMKDKAPTPPPVSATEKKENSGQGFVIDLRSLGGSGEATSSNPADKK